MMKNRNNGDFPQIFENSIIRSDMEDIFSRKIPWNEFENCTVLITGAYGMLASYIAYFFVWLNEEMDKNITLIAAVRNREKAQKVFGNILDKKYFRLYLEDINEKFEFSERIDYIFHAAGIANPKLYSLYPTEVAKTNVIATYNLLNWALDHPIKGFLMFSSGDVYGRMINQNIIYEEDMGITDPLDIHSCYGESKRMSETWCMTYAKEYNVHAVAARICHTYGPLMDLENDPRVFASFVKNALEKTDIEILSDGTACRPFCYITDAVAAFLLLILRGKSGEAYNVSNSTEFISVKQLAFVISSLTSEESKVIIKGTRNDGYLESKNNHENCPVEDKLEKLGWKHIVNVEEGFRRVLMYHEKEKALSDSNQCS